MPWQVTLLLAILGALNLGLFASIAWTVCQGLSRRKRLGAGEPECGRCGYIVRAGGRTVCPECGSDLSDVGIVTAATAPPPFPFLALWVCSVGATLLAWWAGPRLALATPWGWDFHAGRQIHTSRTRWVPSMHEAAFSVNAKGFGRGRVARVRELSVSYKIPDAHWISLDIDRAGETCRIRTRPRPIGPLPFGPDAVERFVEEAGFDPSAPEGVRLRDQVLSSVRDFLVGNLPPETARLSGDWPGRTQFDSIQHWPDEYASWVAGALVWLAAMAATVVCLRRWQRHRRSAVIRHGRVLVTELGLT
jgi:hypothetical protein